MARPQSVLCSEVLLYTGVEDHFCMLLWTQTEGKNGGGLGTRLECDNGATV